MGQEGASLDQLYCTLSERVGPLKLINENNFQGVFSVLVLHA